MPEIFLLKVRHLAHPMASSNIALIQVSPLEQ